ncbi:MAG: SCO family protein, partial [Sphingomonas sp.]
GAAARHIRAIMLWCMALAFAGALASCSRSADWHNTDVTGSLPALDFTMTRARDGKTVSAADYRGKVTLLYFGYSFCPDVCPLTLSNVAQVMQSLGPASSNVRVLFVTVDPDRDTLDILKRYETAFGPQVDALRGTPDQLLALARRYRVAYSVTPGKGDAYEVTHSSGIYAFDRAGKPRLLISSLSSGKPDLKGTAADIQRLLH